MIEVLTYTALYFVLFGITEALYHKGNWDAEKTRKVVHVGTGLLALTFPVYLEAFWQVAFLCLSFLLLMAISERFQWFKSITGVDRKSYGSWLFAGVVMMCFYLYMIWDNKVYYYFPLMVLSLSDPLAALVGKARPIKEFRVFKQKKSLGGSTAFFLSALLLGLGYFISVDSAPSYGLFLLATAVSTGAEFLSVKGWDNLTIPVSIIVLFRVFL
jgi:phytol kinase